MQQVKECLGKCQPYFYFAFRVLVGLMFLQHGVQKLFGWFSNGAGVQLYSLMGLAGVIETAAGVLIALGLFTRSAALLSSAVMLVAYFKVHFPMGWVPILNQGELALLYLAAFLVLMTIGAGKWSLEKALFKEERY